MSPSNIGGSTKMHRRLGVLVVVCLTLALVGACASAEKKSGCKDCPDGMMMAEGGKPCCPDDATAAVKCPVSGKGLAEGKGIEKEIGGKKLTFCCPKCVAKYEANPEKYQQEG